ncbi:GcrA cell cycle regulator (plasmid) [Lichenicola cladoniae]|uniref:GcrA cell cycle regulator n=2 Tax=Lichenicola cladoniae TaxID=1484109 RepID=A0A6M8HXW7_9PROT|nr:GcrA family cell cycle regulator [Lichenicola cladoniae]NPD66286.1 GcrA cell cycle regulator [Acetobacteraceae bacterium]QKE93180.1 GcrA cell cycle regulator [Lichenicola cladoniae]
MSGNNFEWSDEVVHSLRELWADGHSTAEIGRRIGASKNAVVGKAHRLNLPGRPSPIAQDTEQPKRPSKPATVPRLIDIVPVSVTEPLPPRPTPSPVHVTVAATNTVPPKPPVSVVLPQPEDVFRSVTRRASRTCCWPIGEPGTKTFRFCDAAVESRTPYCLEHACKAYVRRAEPSQETGTSAG